LRKVRKNGDELEICHGKKKEKIGLVRGGKNVRYSQGENIPGKHELEA